MSKNIRKFKKYPEIVLKIKITEIIRYFRRKNLVFRLKIRNFKKNLK